MSKYANYKRRHNQEESRNEEKKEKGEKKKTYSRPKQLDLSDVLLNNYAYYDESIEIKDL